ncbi:MAG: ATP-binding protein [Paracoccaceae bacterium]|nr:ATP-binding protein [Paracoccaceae bacterium]
MTSITTDEPTQAFSEDTWRDVIAAMDRTYSELVEYQELLEKQNTELDELRQFMNSVLSSVSDLLIVVDKNRNIERTGGAIRTILGPRAAAEAGLPLADLLETSEQGTLFEVIDQVMRDRDPRMVETQFATPDGPTPLEVSVSPRLDQRGRSQGVVLVGRPVGELRNAYLELEASHTALQQAQTQLVRNEKLASLGRLVAGVAHELNNPISFVYANTHALEKYTERFETYFDAVQAGKSRPELVALRDELRLEKTVRNLRTAINGAKDGAERVRDIVEDLRRLSAEGTGDEVSFDLMTTVRTAADWVARGTKTPVKIHFDGAVQKQARGNPGHVQQIVMNLVQNAIDALAGAEDPHVTLRVFDRDTDVVLHVIDNGPGIAEADAASIFDPFFTTKEVGKGTGLGLSISHKIAEEHGGALHLVTSAPGGCCFELALPAEEAA